MTQMDIELVSSFPPEFLWGAATAAYQIEGATREDGRSLSIWDTFSATPGKVFQGDTGDVAVNHYHMMQADVDLMARLGLKGYRFSISWPRVMPQGRGIVNAVGLDFYDYLVDALLEKGIKPFATLYHWDLPQALQDEGGWAKRDTAYAFADYAEVVVKRLGDRVANWITHNEPWCTAFLGHCIGVHAPGLKDKQMAFDVGHHLLLSHGLAVPRLRAYLDSSAQVGITLNLAPAYAADDSPEARRGVDRADSFGNRWFLEPLFRGSYPERLFEDQKVNPPPIQEGDFTIISTPIDFLGVNNYSRTLIASTTDPNAEDNCRAVVPVPGSCYTDMGWEIYPEGLRDLLVQLHRDYAIPAMYVTENGAAFKDIWNGDGIVSDPRRVSFLREHLQACAQAIEQGVILKGYFVWSLLDNFEWAEGYGKRFGIVYVDYPSQRRIIKDSGHWYASLIESFHQVHQT